MIMLLHRRCPRLPKYQQSFRKTGYKEYPVKMTAKKTYIIDMARSSAAENKLMHPEKGNAHVGRL
jgi:hypothetical protein